MMKNSMTKKCVTHHFACDCREEVFKELLQASKRMTITLNMSYFDVLLKEAQDELNIAIAKTEKLYDAKEISDVTKLAKESIKKVQIWSVSKQKYITLNPDKIYYPDKRKRNFRVA